MELKPNTKLDIREVLKDLEHYHPRRREWVWRKKLDNQQVGPFDLHGTTEPLKNSVPLPSAKYFDGIDPQCQSVITTEIASGRFEDDIRRMRMAAWHGADHIMVIRTTGQSHFDGIIEGTPEGVGGIPITRKQIRASKKALDAIEDEVGRPINFHSYVSGVAGPEVAVLFSEEGVNGAHQDPQYNVFYRNINMHRSFVDACEAKKVMADAQILQIDGAHNANATARQAWKVLPELLVQHGINSAFSVAVGMKPDHVALSTVPPTAPPAPKLKLDLPYAIALRDFFSDYRMRAQQNTRYMEDDTYEATTTHVIDTLISALTSADIQSTITPDEGRNVPWHYNNILAVNSTRQTFMGLDGMMEMVCLKDEGMLPEMVREIKERAVLFLEELIEEGGFFQAIADGQFVDSGFFPERRGDGIAREPDGGVAAGSIVERDADYGAPVCSHYGHNSLAPADGAKACDPIDGCTICNPEKIVYIDELDENDNVNRRLETPLREREEGIIRPEVEWAGDGTVLTTIFVPEPMDVAEIAVIEMAKLMNLEDPEIVRRQVIHPSEGSLFEVKGRLTTPIYRKDLVIPVKKEYLPEAEIDSFVRARDLHLVAATVGEDEHSVGMREILDIKHGGVEKYGFHYHYLGTSVPVGKLLDAAQETGSKIIMISTIITHNDIHKVNMRRLADLAVERGIRDELILIAGGTQVTDEIAKECGMDAGFGRGTKGHHVASMVVERLREMGV